MQLVLSKSNYVEKILRDSNGQLCRATFCVYENGGRMKARLVKVVYLDENEKIENKAKVLVGLCNTKSYKDEIFFESGIISPYFSLNKLYFSGSKPRAPTK